MPPVEFDSIPRFVSESFKEGKTSLEASNSLELGSFDPIITRSKGTTPVDSGLIEDVEVPEVDSEDETTVHKLLKDYSEAESEDDSDYVPSEDSETEEEPTSNDFVITRSKGIAPQEFVIKLEDVDIPEVDSEDETTIDKIMKDYSDEEEAANDSDYAPSEASDDDLEFDTDASISEDDVEHEDIEDVVVPKVHDHFTRRTAVIHDVDIPKASNVVVKDSPVGHHDNELAAIAHNIVHHIAGNPFVQAALKTLDYGLDICEKIVAPVSTPYKEHVQGVRRHLRAVRRSGNGRNKTGVFAYCIELFKVNWFLSFIGMTLTVGSDSFSEKGSTGSKRSGQEYSDDEESTVYKLMKEYDSQDDDDYVPSDCSEDSMEFDSDCSDDETTVDKLMMEYSETDDLDYVPCDESEDDSLEYDSDAEVSDDSDYDSSDVEDCSEDETTVDKLMKDYSDEESDFDADYVPGEEVEDDLEFHSDASVTETEDSESEVESEDEVCSEVECDEIVDESVSQDEVSQDEVSQDEVSQDDASQDDASQDDSSQDVESNDEE